MDPLFDSDSSEYDRPETGRWPTDSFTGQRTMWIPAVGEITVYLEDGQPTALEGAFVHELAPGDVVDLMDDAGNLIFEVEPLVDHYGHDGSPTGDFLLIERLDG